MKKNKIAALSMLVLIPLAAELSFGVAAVRVGPIRVGACGIEKAEKAISTMETELKSLLASSEFGRAPQLELLLTESASLSPAAKVDKVLGIAGLSTNDAEAISAFLGTESRQELNSYIELAKEKLNLSSTQAEMLVAKIKQVQLSVMDN